MTREERLKALFDELEKDAYNAEYHNYYYKEANQIIRKHFELSLPPAEGAEEIFRECFAEEAVSRGDTPLSDEKWNDLVKESGGFMFRAMEKFATLHAQRIADKMKEANQFILDIAGVLGIETDGVGFDGLTLGIDDFKEAGGYVFCGKCGKMKEI